MFNTQKKILAGFAILVFSLNLFYASFVWIDFKINQDVIAKTLCVQKDVVESTCQGSCHLKKQLDKIEENKGSMDNVTFEVTETHINNLFYGEIEKHAVLLNTRKACFDFKNPVSFIQKGFPTHIFQPPIVG